MKIKKRFGLALAFFSIVCYDILTAQSTGLLMEDSVYEQLPSGNLEKVKDHFVPKMYSLKAYSPFPASQGKISSCVGWAAGYGALTIERAIKSGITDRVYVTDQLAHSAIYIYQNIKRGADCQALASITDALNFLHKNGDCLESTLPTPTMDCAVNPSLRAREEALKFTIESPGFKIFSSDQSSMEKIRSAKAHLAAGHPVIVGIAEAPPYRSLVGKDIWNVEPRMMGGHAMVLVGYSDEDQRFELMNSYGTTWGNQGFIDISYEDFSRFCKQAFVLDNTLGAKGINLQTSDHIVSLSMEMAINIWRDKSQSFQPLNFRLKDQVYESQDTVPTFGPVSLNISVEQGRCSYLFNMDSEGIVKSIWSFEYPAEDTILNIPEEGWWEFPTAGQEMFCVVYGYEPLTDLNAFVHAINLNPDPDFRKKILSQKGINSCDGDQIKYSAAKIHSQALLPSSFDKWIPTFFTINVSS